MSKAAKQSILILIILLLGSLGFAGYTLFEKQNLEREKQTLEANLEASQEREDKRILEVKKLTQIMVDLESQKDLLNGKVAAAESRADELLDEVKDIKRQRDDWRRRLDTITRERDDLTAKVRGLESQLSQATTEAAALKASAAPKQPTPPPVVAQPVMTSPAIPAANLQEGNDQYWANILREKAALEVEIENLQERLTGKTVEIVELKQSNAGLKLELDALKSSKEAMSQDIEFKANLVNNLSLELARTKSDKKISIERIAKLNNETRELRRQLKELVTSKSSLEKSIVRLSQDKNKVEKELLHTENVVQDQINEIWDIKDNIDRTFKSHQKTSSEIELSPIVVTSNGSENLNATPPSAGLNGTVLSINEENNFVIVNQGQRAGVVLGDNLSVYRDSKYIARLEVIQVRQDISAADIKDQWTKIMPGDIVR